MPLVNFMDAADLTLSFVTPDRTATSAGERSA